MSERTILNVESPKTQSIDAIKALLSWRGRAADPLPSFVELGEGEGKVVLVLSNKRDAYYTVTARDCSCPAAIYHHGPCKHQRKYFPEQSTHKQSMAETLEQAERNLPRMPYQYQRMVKAAREAADSPLELTGDHKPFRPIIEDEVRPAAEAATPVFQLVDCLPDPTARDLAYHSIQADREMWLMVEA